MMKNSELDLSNIDLTYEEALEILEETINSLETNEHSLDEALNKFEQGQILATYCLKLLTEAELKIRSIMEEHKISSPEEDYF